MYLKKLLTETDILCVQEHWLFNYEKLIDFDYTKTHEVILNCVDDADPRLDFKHLRGFGGTGIFWKKSLSDNIKTVDTCSDRICVILIESDRPYCIINVYMPSSISSGDNEYKKVLTEIGEIMETFKPTHKIILCGDMNASLVRNNPRDKTFQKFVEEYQLCTDEKIREKPTFWHHNHKFQSQIDYIFALRRDLNVNIHEMNPVNVSDHTLLTTELDLKLEMKNKGSKHYIEIRTKPKWKKGNIPRYREEIKAHLKKPTKQDNTKSKLNNLIHTLHQAGQKSIPSYRKLKKVKTSYKHIWNRQISKASKDSKQCFKIWKDTGKKEGEIKQEMNRRKKRLRQLQRQAAANIRKEENEKLMTAATSDKQTFYKLIKKQRKTKNESTQVLWIDEKEISETSEILQTWENHFQMLSTPKDDSYQQEKTALARLQNKIIEEIELEKGPEIPPVTHLEVKRAIKSLNTGKAEDLDGITAEHFQNAEDELIPVLLELINDIFKMLDVPEDLKKGVLTPVLKKDKDKRIPGNYRGITVTSCFAKLLEAILKDRIDILFESHQSKLQRGFTSKSSAINAAFLITETINYHKDLGKPLFMVSLDAQKAFDTVNHEILFNKLYH